MRTFRLDVQPLRSNWLFRDRVAVTLSTEPALDGSDALGIVFLPLAWVRVLRILEPAIAIVNPDVVVEWTGLPLEVVPDPRIRQVAKIVRRAVTLFSKD